MTKKRITIIALILFFSLVVFSGDVFIKAKTGNSLRAKYKHMTNCDIRKMLKKKGMFDVNWNPAGDFMNQYIQRESNGETVVVDNATGLMWHNSGSTASSYEEARAWIADLNRNGFAGFNDWRLPTAEEGASLLESIGQWDSSFSETPVSFLTGDYIQVNKSERNWWMISGEGGVTTGSRTNPQFGVRPVRTAE